MAFSPENLKILVNSREIHAFIQTATYSLFTKGTWLALEGEVYTISDLQAMFTTSGVLITDTADVKMITGVQIIPHCPVPWPSLCRFWCLHRPQTPPLGSFYYGGTPSSGEYMATRSEQNLGRYWASRRQIKCPSSGVPNSLN